MDKDKNYVKAEIVNGNKNSHNLGVIIIVILSFKAIKRHKNNSPFNVSNPPLS